LGTFIFIVITAVYKPTVFKENPVLHQIVGMIEGVALSVFAYYYSTTKSSSDKTKLIEKMMNK
jgi:xanthine/uracil permease